MGYTALGRDSRRFRTKELMFDLLISEESGACAAGVAPIGETPAFVMEAYGNWLSAGRGARMDYLANHLPIRRNPALLLEGAKTVISLAFPYPDGRERAKSLPAIASYAQGMDYHDVLRSRLTGVTERLKAIYGGNYRICIDSAPIFERYWAEKCRIGKRCDNGLIVVNGYGTRVFLAEILTTLPPDTFPFPLPCSHIAGESTVMNSAQECTHCGACRRICPAGALQEDSTVDARRCLSYLTIEHRGEWDREGNSAMSTPAGRHTLFGCDLCQKVCPLNSRDALRFGSLRDSEYSEPVPADSDKVAPLPEFLPRPEILTLTSEDITMMTPADFSRGFKGSPLKRSKLAGLLRNALNTMQSGK